MRRLLSIVILFAVAGSFGDAVGDDVPTEKTRLSYLPDQEQVKARLSSLDEVPFDRVRINDLFWAPRIERVQDTTIPDVLKIAEQQGKIDNLRIIAGRKKTGRIRIYNSPDSDIWKIMEAASYTLAWRDDPELEHTLDELIALYAEAQAEDGYINQMYMLPVDHPQSPEKYRQGRYGRELQFEGTIDEWAKGIGQLYSSGHLFEAAAAHYRATGKQNFLQIAIRMADRIYREFPPGEPINYADHPQTGIGLIKLYEVTGDEKYLRLADHIVHHGHHGRPPDLGNRESWRPIEQQRKAWGHAVRINYLYSAATDLCRYLDQPDTRVALDSLWHSIVDRRIYVTGGIGGPAHAEQLADDYVLDNRNCYCECCSNIAHGQWNHRLNLLHGDAAYADVVEIEAYNAGLAGISLKGTEYFYTNKLAVGKQGRSGPHSGVRKRYLFCCPAKLPGFVAGIGRWVYAKDARGVYVNLYVGGSATVELPDCSVGLIQKTSYPWNGHVSITVEPDRSGPFDLCLRIPGWAQGQPFPGDLYRFDDASRPDWVVKINGERVDATDLDKGYVRLSRAWNSGDRVELDLTMPVRRVYACENVKHDRGRVALMRGPIVYCLEGVDHDFSVLSMVLPKKAKIEAEHREDLLNGVTVLKGRGLTERGRPVEFVAVPYYAWQNRGIDEMTVWIVEDPHVLSPDGGDSISRKNPADPTASDSMPTRAGSSDPDTRGKSPVKVFILAGQSNMEGQGKIRLDPNRNQGKGTLEYLVKNPATAERFRHIVDDKGDWVTRKDVWIWYLGRKGGLTVGYGARNDRIGPEFQFGHVLGDYFDNQVLLIKTAWGGKSLAKDFRPPSSGGEVGPYYTEMIRHVKNVLANLKEHFADYDGGGYEIAGFGWHQGWNDGCSVKDTNQYEENLIHFIRDIRREFGNKDIPFVIANSGFGGWKQKIDRRLKIIQAQAAPLKHKEFEGTVACVETRDFFRPPEVSPSRQGYHWNSNAETYFLIGDSMGRAMIRLCTGAAVDDGAHLRPAESADVKIQDDF